MATQVQFRRGTTAQHGSFTGAIAEITVDTDKETVVVHDGSTAGGFPLATEANLDKKLAVANAVALYVTKTDAVTSNNAVKVLIEDRMQVANVTSIQTSLTNLIQDRMQVANVTSIQTTLQSSIDTNTTAIEDRMQVANVNSIQTSLTNLIEDRMQVANVTSIQTTLQNSINDRLQIANAASIYAPLASPSLTGAPTAPTAAGGTNTTQIATTAYVRGEVTSLVDSAPAALDTLNELAAALGDDANFSATVTNLIGTKLAVSNANLIIAADSGTNDSVSLVTDTLTFEGTANEILTTVSNNKINISQPENVTIGNNLTVSANVVATGTISAADFNSTSDQRLKKNIENAKDPGSILDQIVVRQFDWIESGKHQQFGFVAQELVDVYPDAVVPGSNPEDIWRINYNLVVPLLVKEIQQLKTRIKNLEDN